MPKIRLLPSGIFSVIAITILISGCGLAYSDNKPAPVSPVAGNKVAPVVLDTALFDKRWQQMANGDSLFLAKVKRVYPLPGAILPFKRIIAFYGNLYSKKMGILGEIPEAQMFDKLKAEVNSWQQADSTMTVIPALHYIAVTAQGQPGKDHQYRLRMPFAQIDTILAMAKKIDALVFIDIQVGFSTLEKEVPLFLKYLSMPNVHLGIDPEFSMKGTATPGKEIGTFNAADINYTAGFLAKLVRDNNLPPKMLVIHRFTKNMVTGADSIQLRPEVQIVMDMDGWGQADLKKATYRSYITKQPVQFTGFKLFYKNDCRMANSRVMTPAEVLALKPQPVYIQYQ